ncbi:transporter substrate-binding domain-containing protein [Pseudoalteromonas sp. DL2-H2.2]|uniref:substrate-binding periplasmic protein n=1 Tax=Pseudoalteromonas sp. DL2-H2.2 TaxID=2908889 RepID=UPI001F1B9D45|nr:transporter substrate-binding domain-containing protein [Pseudoalteromonas sp. DL2-H2.2]MCF2907290.1 transporter substrate-binding domain-containing protein [Pseudoalteromonas sp. DL2-H2.2]
MSEVAKANQRRCLHRAYSGYIQVMRLLVWFSIFTSNIVRAASPIPVTILADDSYPPYSYVQDGKLVGIYPTLILEAAKLIKEEYQVELRPIPWKRGVAALEQGEAFALMPPYIHLDTRPYIWPYSVALKQEEVVAFCNPGITLQNIAQRDGELAPINIGLNAGFLILDDALKEARKAGRIIVWENKNTRANIIKLYKKRVDCYINDRLSTLIGISDLQDQLPGLSAQSFVEDHVVLSRSAHIGYLKGYEGKYPYKADFIEKMDEALNTVLQKATPP